MGIGNTTGASYSSREERAYAELLHWLALAGLLLLIAAFVVYGLGIFGSIVSPGEATRLWHHSAAEYAEAAGLETGWGWLSNLPRGDMLAFASLALLAGASIPAQLYLFFFFLKKRNRIFALLALLQFLVLLAAASGIFSR